MKANELIKVLEILRDKHDNPEIVISVRDYYSVYGSRATINVEASGCLWTGIRSNKGVTALDAHLEEYIDFDGTAKKPKITFRK